MGRRLRTFVHVQDKQHQAHVFGPDDELPGWAAKRITNPKAWEDDGQGDEQDAEPAEPTDGEPPRSGRGSGRDVWAAYASEQGVAVSDDATRDDIIAALVDAGVVEAE